jgi:hypothetical protein
LSASKGTCESESNSESKSNSESDYENSVGNVSSDIVNNEADIKDLTKDNAGTDYKE